MPFVLYSNKQYTGWAFDWPKEDGDALYKCINQRRMFGTLINIKLQWVEPEKMQKYGFEIDQLTNKTINRNLSCHLVRPIEENGGTFEIKPNGSTVN